MGSILNGYTYQNIDNEDFMMLNLVSCECQIKCPDTLIIIPCRTTYLN